jgi:hypothetical protein
MLRRLASRCLNVFVNETTEAIDPDDSAVVRFARYLGCGGAKVNLQSLVGLLPSYRSGGISLYAARASGFIPTSVK